MDPIVEELRALDMAQLSQHAICRLRDRFLERDVRAIAPSAFFYAFRAPSPLRHELFALLMLHGADPYERIPERHMCALQALHWHHWQDDESVWFHMGAAMLNPKRRLTFEGTRRRVPCVDVEALIPSIGCTPLHQAACQQRPLSVLWLLQGRGANPNTTYMPYSGGGEEEDEEGFIGDRVSNAVLVAMAGCYNKRLGCLSSGRASYRMDPDVGIADTILACLMRAKGDARPFLEMYEPEEEEEEEPCNADDGATVMQMSVRVFDLVATEDTRALVVGLMAEQLN